MMLRGHKSGCATPVAQPLFSILKLDREAEIGELELTTAGSHAPTA